jgi:transcriptional regulator with XRE-family HTH domain
MSTDNWTAAFADRLKGVRRQHSYTQKRLARLAGVGLGTIRDIEQGRSLPGFFVLRALAHALGCTVTDLTGE